MKYQNMLVLTFYLGQGFIKGSHIRRVKVIRECSSY